MITAALTLGGIAVLVSVLTLVLALLTMRQSSGTASLLRRHRLGHEAREGRKDPAAGEERRRLNLGAPRGAGERRHGGGRLLEAEGGGPAPEDAAPTTAAIPRLPRPGEIRNRR